MNDTNLAELRQACVARGLCSAAAFDEALRTQREMADRGERMSVLDVLVLSGTLVPEHARELRARGLGNAVSGAERVVQPVAARRASVRIDDDPPDAPQRPGTVSVERARGTACGLPSAPAGDAGTMEFDEADLRAVLAAAPSPRETPKAPRAPAPRPAAPMPPRRDATEPGISEPTLDESQLAGFAEAVAAADADGGSNAEADAAQADDAAHAPLPPHPDSATFGADLPGRTLGGCRIERELGRGATGVVFEATHLSLQRRVAVKVLMPSAKRSERDVEQFFQEARTLARVEHQNIVQVYDVGEQDGVNYIAMQLLDGETIADRLDRVRSLSWEEGAKIARDAARGLAVAHEKGIVHRDIKPENIFVTADGVVKIADFGLAAQAAQEEDGGRTEVMGTPAYMSPEQIDGRSVDGRADLYSLGCTLYVMLTGRKPFEGATAIEVLLKQTKEVATPVCRMVPSIPLSVSQVVEKLMAKSPASRYQKAEDLVADLEKILGGGKPKVVVEIEDVMGRMQELIREAEAPKANVWGRPSVVIASAAVVVAAVGVLLTIALPAVDVPELDRTEYFGGDDDAEVQERQAKAALAETEALVAKLGDRLDLVHRQYDELEKRWGAVYPAPIAASRELAVAQYEQRRDAAIADVRMRAAPLVKTDPVGAVETLLSLPPHFRAGTDGAGWAQDLDKAVAALRAATGMTFVPGGRCPVGPEGTIVETKPFLLDVAEVTNGEYAKFVEGTGARAPKHWGGAQPPAAIRDLPVVGVRADEADQYARWSGRRLPTSLEWERAARGAEGAAYPWGDEFDPARCVARHVESKGLVFVRSYSGGRSPEGAFHMAGNAAEWTADEATDPTLAGRREVRGGSTRSHSAQCTGYARYWLPADTDDPDLLVGFRCARDVR